MRAAVELAARPGFAAYAVSCEDDHRGWSAPEQRSGHGLVLVRRGRFRRRLAGRVADVDPTVGYVSLPGDEEYFAHPAGGDVCTSITVSPDLWHTTAGASEHGDVYVDARLDLAHRRLLAAVRGQDVDYAVVEALLHLLGVALRRATVGVHGSDSALVARARAAIADGHPGLLPLAELLEVSPYRLSRAFSRELGVSLTYYRNRVRVGKALDRLEAGESDLAALAVDLGFADQAHLTRTVRAHSGETPAVLRRLLSPSPA